MAKSQNKKKMKISLIIPAYKQEKTIVKDIQKIVYVLSHLQTHTYEVIVVVDGEVDKTFLKAKQMVSRRIKVIGYPHNHGKGYAVRYGMTHAKGDIIAFLDAGMDLDPQGLVSLLETMQAYDADIVVGSKLHPSSQVIYPWQRKILSWGYRSFVKIFFGLSLRDTQVGMKLFKRRVLVTVLPRLLVKSYAFDIEILAVAHHLGYAKIYEAPITLTFNHWSSITSTNFWRPIIHMLWDTSAVYYRLHILRYYDNKSKRKWKYDPELKFRVNLG
jgi:glycosyltransferase involved in cell wall biosynthesis